MLMRYFYLLCLLILGASTLPAQFSVETLTPFDFATNFRDVYVDDSGNGWAVGTCNVLARTENNGQDWEILNAPEGRDYEIVACKPGTDCQTIYLGAAGLVVSSTDGGNSWTETELVYSSPRDFSFVDDNIVVLSHGDSGLFRSTDSGATWTEITFEHFYRGRAHFPSATVGYVFQSGGPLLKSTDAGATWDSVYQFDASAYYGDWLDENTGFMYDQNRHLFKTTDGGNNWTLVTDTGVPSNLRYMAALSETALVAYVFPSNIFRSEDGGVTWLNNSSIGENQYGLRYQGIHNDGDNFWISSWGTEILYSTDGLETATSQFPGLRPSLEAVQFPTNNVGYALQERVGMLKTTDGGNTWNQLTNDFFTVSRDFLVLDEQTVIIPYNSSGPQITEDGGQSWAPLFPDEMQDTVYVFHIEQLPSGRLYLYGSVHGAYSDDGGDTWNVVYHGFSGFPRGMIFVDDQRGYVGSDGGRLYATTDGGESWVQVLDGDFTNQPLRNIFALDDNTIMISVSSTSRCSTDGGMTWSTDACNGVTAPGAIVVGPDGTYYSGQLFPSQEDLLTNIQRSMDGGLTWESIAGFCTYAIPGEVTPDGRYLYVYQSAGFLGRVDLESVGTEDITPSEITEALVYPNPTTGQVQIALPEDAVRAEVAVFNLQGQLVAQQKGNGPVMTLDLEGLSKGMYLLQVQGDGWLQSAKVVKE